MDTSTIVIGGIALTGVGIGVYSILSGQSIKDTIDKISTSVGGGISGGLEGLNLTLPAINLPSISTLTNIIPDTFSNLGSKLTESINSFTSGLKIPEIKLPNVSGFISTGISNIVQAPFIGIAEGMRLSIQNNPIAVGTLTGIGIGATMGSVIPVIGTLVGGGIGGLAGLLSTAFVHKALPDIQTTIQKVKDLTPITYRGTQTKAIGETAIETFVSKTIAIPSVISSGLSNIVSGVTAQPIVSSGAMGFVQTATQTIIKPVAQIKFEQLTPEPFRRFIYGW